MQINSKQDTRIIKFETDYGFLPTPPNEMPGIPEEYQADLVAGRLQLVLRRCVTPNRWTIVKADPKPNKNERWDINGIIHRLDGYLDLSLFTQVDASHAVVDYGPSFLPYFQTYGTGTAFADAGKPLWTRYAVDLAKVKKAILRRSKAVQCAATFNKHHGLAPCALTALSDEALAILCLSKEQKVWMFRSLADAVRQLVRAGYGRVSPDGFVEVKPDHVTQAVAEWSTRNVRLEWTDPLYIEKRKAAYEAHPRRRFSSFKGKYPETPYEMEGLCA